MVKGCSVLEQRILYPYIEPSTATVLQDSTVINVHNSPESFVYSALKSKELCDAFGKLSTKKVHVLNYPQFQGTSKKIKLYSNSLQNLEG